MGRGDRRGATRLACFVLCLNAIQWLFEEHHIANFGELTHFISAAGVWLFKSGLYWLLYIALEPFVRRRWPVVLVGWNRLLAGDYRDSLVGRDLLFGCTLGVLTALLHYLRYPLATLFNASQIAPSTGDVRGVTGGTFHLFSGVRGIFATSLAEIISSIEGALILGFILFLVMVLFRRTWAAILALMVLAGAFLTSGESSFISSIPIFFVIGIYVFVYFRVGKWLVLLLYRRLLLLLYLSP